MIKFFRHIRQSLIKQNKMGHYFKYAIGEIVLVVIGILIALQINTLNQNRLNKQTEIEYLKGIHDDLNSLINDWTASLQLNQSHSKTINKLLDNYISNERFIASDSLMEQINSISSVSIPNEFNTSFTELLNSGDIKLIRNDRLRKQIVSFYQQTDKVIYKSRTNINNLVNRFSYPEFFENTLLIPTNKFTDISDEFENFNLQKEYPKRTKALVYKHIEDEGSEIRLVNALNTKLVMTLLQIDRSKTIIHNAKDLINKIEKEVLEQHNVYLNTFESVND